MRVVTGFDPLSCFCNVSPGLRQLRKVVLCNPSMASCFVFVFGRKRGRGAGGGGGGGGLGGYSLQFIGHNILRFKVTGKKRPFIILIDVRL